MVSALDSVTRERDELVHSRLPGLEGLSYDETLQVAVSYVRNISFTMTMQNEIPAYEYRVVFSNTGLSTVIPNLRIMVFDKLGIQLGEDGVPGDVLEDDTLVMTLEQGEVRTYSGTIEVLPSRSPTYYLLHID